jgi:hypothetical protein
MCECLHTAGVLKLQKLLKFQHDNERWSGVCPRIGSEAEGADVSRRATRGDGDFLGDWNFRGEEVPHRTSIRLDSMEEF